MDPFEIFPEEMWKLIFEKVENAQDWLNLYRASPEFEELVGEKRRNVLFPKVLELVSIHSDIARSLDPNDFIGLRLVSPGSRDVIDKLIDTSVDGWLTLWCQRKYDFEDLARLNSFLEKFETHPRSTVIIGKHLAFDYEATAGEDPLAMEDFGTSVSKTLAKHGNSLQQLSIHGITYAGVGGSQRFMRQLRSFMLQVPNLKELTVTTSYRRDVADDDDEPMITISGNLTPENYLLPNLETFNYRDYDYGEHDGGGVVAQQLLDDLIQMCGKGPSVTKVNLTRLPTDVTAFPNLKDAILGDLRKENRSRLGNYSSWSLSTLGYYGKSIEDNGELVDVPELFGAIQTFKDSLINLELDFLPCEPTTVCPAGFRIDLPHLRDLKIWRTSMNLPLECFMNLHSLQKLDVINHITANEDQMKVAKLFEMKIDQSKIRDLMPKLKLSYAPINAWW